MERHISEVLKRSAAEAIEAKVSVLQEWKTKAAIPWILTEKRKPARDDDGRPLLDYFPDDELAFCRWVPEMNCPSTLRAYPLIQKFRSVSPSTLRQSHNENSRRSVLTAIAALKELSELQKFMQNPTKVNETLAKERDYWQTIAIEGTKDVIKQRRRASALERLYRRECRARQTNDSTAAEVRANLEAQIAELRKEISKIATFTPRRRT